MGDLHVDKIFSIIKNGCTEPLDASLDSGERVVVKPINNIEGNLVLINEYICYKLCMILDILIPSAGIATIDNKTVCLSESKIITSDNFGRCFFSKRIDKATVINAKIIPRISNKENFYKMILFDHLVYNKDRNRGNMLLSMGKNAKMFVIDHSHVFKNECIWNKRDFKRGIECNDYNDKIIMESNNEVYNFFWMHFKKDIDILLQHSSDFKKKINYIKIDEITKELPIEWLALNEDEDIDALKDYLIYRLEHLDEICNIIVGR